MAGLHRPVAIDPQHRNFQDLRLTVHCVPEGLLNAESANQLCLRVGTLFENQGAQVTTNATTRSSRDDEPGEDASEAADLTLELRARQIHEADSLLSWVLCLGTFTLVPAVSEFTFAQDVAIRDETGFLLLSDSLVGRIVTRYGAGTWIGNTFADLLVRDRAEKLIGDAFDRDISSDFYRQLSQLMFNAEMRREVLQLSRVE